MFIGGNLKIGSGTADVDYKFEVNGETYDGVITFMEDEDRWDFSESIQIGDGTATDFTIGVDASANDGLITFDESDDEWEFSEAIYVTGAAHATGAITGDSTLQIDSNVTIGDGTATDFTVTLDALTNDGLLTFDESDDEWEFSEAITSSGGIRPQSVTGAAPTEPFTCNSANEGYIVYVDDTDDTQSSGYCFCGNVDGTGYDWRDMSDRTAACPFF
jgi:hypothetical protein